jgi:hypothetical protein
MMKCFSVLGKLNGENLSTNIILVTAKECNNGTKTRNYWARNLAHP